MLQRMFLMPRPKTDRKRGGQEKDTEPWQLRVRESTIAEFKRIAGPNSRKMAARFLDDLAQTALKNMPNHNE